MKAIFFSLHELLMVIINFSSVDSQQCTQTVCGSRFIVKCTILLIVNSCASMKWKNKTNYPKNMCAIIEFFSGSIPNVRNTIWCLPHEACSAVKKCSDVYRLNILNYTMKITLLSSVHININRTTLNNTLLVDNHNVFIALTSQINIRTA